MSQPTPAPTEMLAIDDLCVWRGERCLIDGLSFALDAGELLWLRGDNGVGKTTLLRALAGLGHVERGTIAWRGRDARGPSDALRDELLYLGHLDALKRALTARENLSADCALRGGAGPARDAAAIEAALGALGLAAAADLAVAQLSAGQRRRVALARLALSRAPLWLLDEPTTHLDQAGRSVVARLLERHLAGGGVAVVASHLPLESVGAVRELELAAPGRRAA